MKKLTVIAILALISAGSAFADGLSREQVINELQRARATGELAQLQSEDPSAIVAGSLARTSSLSRASVIADLQRARRSGELDRADAEAYGPSGVIQTASSKTRAQVLAELQAARDSGELALLNSDDPSAYLLQGARTPERLAGQATRSAQ